MGALSRPTTGAARFPMALIATPERIPSVALRILYLSRPSERSRSAGTTLDPCGQFHTAPKPRVGEESNLTLGPWPTRHPRPSAPQITNVHPRSATLSATDE